MHQMLPTFLAAHPRLVLVTLEQAMGSTPREAGVFMLVAEEAIWGTIGGGQFEYMAIDNARALLSGSGLAAMDIPLGPEIGQCCGGRTRLTFQVLTPALAEGLLQRLRQEDEDRPAVYLFGAGHVGHALARALAPLPFAVTVVETRTEALDGLPDETAGYLTAMPETAVKDIAAGGAAIILTHDHALDFLIAREALARDDLAYIGMIGSATKRATFAKWLKRQGESEAAERLVLPIGGPAVKDKRPAVIAAMVAAELLTVYGGRSRLPAVRDSAAHR